MQAIHSKKGDHSQIILRREGEQLEVEDSAKHLNEYFTNIGPNLARDFNPNGWVPLDERREDEVQGRRINYDEVRKLCKEIKISKASGYENLSSKVLKDSFLVLTSQLVYLLNLSLGTSIFPDDWKIASIVPLHKGGSREEIGNYRPVSLLPLPGKILERCVHAQLSFYLEENNILVENQGGFRKNKSTVSSMARLTDGILTAMNDSMITMAAFIDLRKAFDTVNHRVLLAKLDHIGIRGELYYWCENYLCNRKQCTLANSNRSSLNPVVCGVPQGSVLGPLFFLIYINDMVKAVEQVEISLFADDTVLFVRGKNVES